MATSTRCRRGHEVVVRNANGDCVECNRERAREWRIKNPERSRANGAKWARENPEMAFNARLIRDYGITAGEYRALEEAQGALCAACGEPEKTRSRLCVDHCHDSGAVRGLLCTRCNVALGMLDDSAEKIRALLGYLGEAA